MIPIFIDRSKIPHKPGVYIFKDSQNSVLYVGKAIDLYHRVGSYFNGRFISEKQRYMVERIRGLETIVVESEIEALILEANLIKKNLPPFNIKLTDDKDYLYVLITKEDYPRVVTGRKPDLKKAKKFYGPFPSSRVVRSTLKKLRRIFPWCASPPGLAVSNKLQACFYYHLGLCPGVCVGKYGVEEYRRIIRRFSTFMEGKKEELIKELEQEMLESSLNLEFEKAQSLKKTIDGLNYLTSTNRVNVYLDNPNFLEEEREQALKQLKIDLGLSQVPGRVECFDISNISGDFATGSMVVFTGGDIDTSQYRRFKIKITGKPNDVGMHREMIKRRLNHAEWEFPQLILVDGGRGQVNAYKEELDSRGLKIPLFGLAKRNEWLYGTNGEIIKIPKRSLSLRLLQRIRDEAHRFAVSYHRKLRSKGMGLGV